MKKLFIFSSLVSLFMFSCKTKKEDPAPAINTTTIIAPNASSDQFGHLHVANGTQYTRLKSAAKSVPNYSTFPYYNIPTASFYTAENGLITVDSVYCSGIKTRLSNADNYFYQSGNITLPINWKIAPRNGFPAANIKITTLPDTFGLADSDFNDSILTTNHYTIKLNKKLIDADKITLSLLQENSSAFSTSMKIVFSKEIPRGMDSLTFNPSELANATTRLWNRGQILVSCFKETSVTTGSTTYNFSTERNIKLNVYLK